VEQAGACFGDWVALPIDRVDGLDLADARCSSGRCATTTLSKSVDTASGLLLTITVS
jgi:hypothetical protein